MAVSVSHPVLDSSVQYDRPNLQSQRSVSRPEPLQPALPNPPSKIQRCGQSFAQEALPSSKAICKVGDLKLPGKSGILNCIKHLIEWPSTCLLLQLPAQKARLCALK